MLVFFSIIVVFLPYKVPEMTVVMIWTYINKTELKTVLSLKMTKSEKKELK